MEKRKLKVYYGRGDYKEMPPQILLQGQWLKRFGFLPGDKITVECKTGQLIITKDTTDTEN